MSREFWQREEFWLGAAIVVAFTVFLALIIAVLTALFTLTSDELGPRVDTIYKLGLLGAGVVTFLTIGWRGLLASRQVQAQREQLDKLGIQIAAAEENNVATLLLKGAEYLTDTGKQAQFAAGLAALESVATSPIDKYRRPALNLIADYLQRDYRSGMFQRLFESAATVLDNASLATNLRSDRYIEIDGEAIEHDSHLLLIRGTAAVRYRKGLMFGTDLTVTRDTLYRFSKVDLHECDVSTSFAKFVGCEFVRCNFEFFDYSNGRTNDFRECDFSGCTVPLGKDFPDLRAGRNFYDPKNPPVSADGDSIDWAKVLHRGKPPPPDDPDDDDSIFFPK